MFVFCRFMYITDNFWKVDVQFYGVIRQIESILGNTSCKTFQKVEQVKTSIAMNKT